MIAKLALTVCLVAAISALSGAYNATGAAILQSAHGPCLPYNETLVPFDTYDMSAGRKLAATYVVPIVSSAPRITPIYVDFGNGTGYWGYAKPQGICGLWPVKEMADAGFVGGAILAAMFGCFIMMASFEECIAVHVILAFLLTGFFAAPLGAAILDCSTPSCRRESFETNAVGFLAGPFVVALVVGGNFFAGYASLCK